MPASASPVRLSCYSMRLAAVLLLGTSITFPMRAHAQSVTALLVGAGGAGGADLGTYAGEGGAGGIGGGGGGGRGASAGGGAGGGGFFGGGGGGGYTGSVYQSGANSGMDASTSTSANGAVGGAANSGAGYQAGAGGGVPQANVRAGGGGGGGLGGAGGGAAGRGAMAGQTGGLAGKNPQVSDVTLQTSPYTISDTETDTIIGVGGGGGGGGDDPGNAGKAGALTIAGQVTSAYVFVGGDGGGGANGYKTNGGAGGAGTLEIESGASLKVAGVNGSSSLLIIGGGNGGSSSSASNGVSSAGGIGGAGAAGALTMDAGSTLILGNQTIVATGAEQYSTSNHFSGGAQGTFTLAGNSTIEVDGADMARVSTAIGGAGALIKTGTGTLALTGAASASTYSGGTDIEAGQLVLNNVVGTYEASTNGALTFGMSANGTNGLLITNSNVDLANAEVNVKPLGGDYQIGQTYTLIIARGGQILNAKIPPNLIGPYAKYVETDGWVSQAQGNLQGSEIYRIVITGEDPDGDPNTGPEIDGGADFVSGGFYGATFYAQNAALFTTLSAPVGTDVGYWVHGVGSFGHLPGSTYNYKGFVAGRGFALNQHLIVGAAISNVYTNTNGVNESSVSGTNFGAQLYGIYTQQKLTITSSIAVGHLGNNATRVVPDLGEGKFASNGIYSGALVQAQYDLLERGPYFAKPYAGVSYLFTNTGRGQETGLDQPVNLNLHYNLVQTSLTQASGGVDVGYHVSVPQGLFTAWVGLGGVGTLGDTHTRITESMGEDVDDLSAQIATVGAFTPAVGVALTGANRPWKLAANWGGQFANKTSAQNFTLQGSYKF